MAEGKKFLQEKLRGARRGLNIFYCGKGKGKTTAAIGLAVRAAGAGMNVYILQFVKARRPKKGIKLGSGEWPVSSEIEFLETAVSAIRGSQKRAGKRDGGKHKIGKIITEQAGLGFVGILGDKKAKQLHVQAAKAALKRAKQIINSGKYDLVILDELVSALELNLLAEREIAALLKSKPKHIHLAYTGHDRFPLIEKLSDLVSEINMVKHPYYSGILAQKGIDF